jgi:hypothetical protein
VFWCVDGFGGAAAALGQGNDTTNQREDGPTAAEGNDGRSSPIVLGLSLFVKYDAGRYSQTDDGSKCEIATLTPRTSIRLELEPAWAG